MEAAKRGVAAVTVCSTAFTGLGRNQAKALGYEDLPIAVVPHPFGIRKRDEIRKIADDCAKQIAKAVAEIKAPGTKSGRLSPTGRCETVEAPGDLEELNQFIFDRKWSDGLPVVPPTVERVKRMLTGTKRRPDEVIAKVAPGYGVATVERIAVNAVMAGCKPEYLPAVIAATQAAAHPRFNLSGVQATTNPAAVFIVFNGPIVAKLGINGANNCLGPGSVANATIGRALRFVLQNIGGGQPGEMDKATHGQPGKYTFCCAENEPVNPWEPLHVERGFAPTQSTVTAIGALGTWNMNTHAKDSADILKVIADTMMFPCGSDYPHGGEPWLILAPEHAAILKAEGYSKLDVKKKLWELTKLSAQRLSEKDFGRVKNMRKDELGDITRDTMLPITIKDDEIGILVAGGTGTHSVYLPVSGHSHSVTVPVDE